MSLLKVGMFTVAVVTVAMAMTVVMIVTMTVVMAVAVIVTVALFTALDLAIFSQTIPLPLLAQQIHSDHHHHAPRQQAQPGVKLLWQNIASGK